jgi:hypothetical protein
MFSGTQREIQQVIKELAILFFFTRELDTETELRNKFVHRDAKCCRIFQKKKTVVKWESAVSCRECFHCHCHTMHKRNYRP